MPTRNEIHALHRYYIWQNRMRVEFEKVLTDATSRGVKITIGTEEDIHSFHFMSYWYAGLYVMIEGWWDLGLHDPEVDELLQSPNVDLLKRYRNGVFHFQRTYYDARFVDLIVEGENVAEWVHALNSAFGRVMLELTRAPQ